MENGRSTPNRKITELSGDFRPFPTGKNRNLAGKIRKISGPEFPETDRFLAVLSDLGIDLLARYFYSYSSLQR